MKKGAGVLLHISSLPSDYGIGTLGKEAYNFINFLSKSGNSYWQILPICPPSGCVSPYTAVSSFAGNPLLIDLDLLSDMNLLKKKEYKDLKWFTSETKVNYSLVEKNKNELLYLAASRFKETVDYKAFEEENAYWLNDFSVFVSLSYKFNKVWNKWPKKYALKDEETINEYINKNIKEIKRIKYIQYFFFKQWFDLRCYASMKDISIIGDLPIYVAYNSSDVWGNRELFKLDEVGNPTDVSGVPPDCFCEDGQKWNNPLYDWKKHKETNYSWWFKRITYLLGVYDVLRIDHFIGFSRYYSIPLNELPIKGKWHKGPGEDFFKELKKQYGNLNIIAEDLGKVTDSTRKLLDYTKFPGMRVYEFAFGDGRGIKGPYLPHNFIKNCVAYTGTHDNEPALGWLKTATKKNIEFIKKYFGIKEIKEFNWLLMSSLWNSKANLTIVQAQDLLDLDEKARMNTPGTVKGNWTWRAKKNDFNDELAEDIYSYLKEAKRINK